MLPNEIVGALKAPLSATGRYASNAFTEKALLIFCKVTTKVGEIGYSDHPNFNFINAPIRIATEKVECSWYFLLPHYLSSVTMFILLT